MSVVEKYRNLKETYPVQLLLIKQGDFYEAFGLDAEIMARELQITLQICRQVTPPISNIGIPYHALQRYLDLLDSQGYSCEVVESWPT
jgi:DNA mismatch repair protein MutS